MDTTLIKADIFFFITAIAVIFLTLLVIVSLVYVISILRTLRYIANKAKTQADLLHEDVNDLRQHIRTKGASVSSIFDLAKNMIKRRLGLNNRKKKTES
jgi:hypothetical protein